MTHNVKSKKNYNLGTSIDSLHRYQLLDEIHKQNTEARIAALQLQSDMHVLEIGCGPGFTALYLATEVVPEGHVLAIDQSQEFINYAKQNAQNKGIKNIDFICANIRDYDFNKQKFDFAHTRCVLTYLPYANEIVEKVYQVLNPDGWFLSEEIAMLYIKHNPPEWYSNICLWFEKLIRYGDGEPDYGLEILPSQMVQAGFTDLAVDIGFPIKNQDAIIEMLKLAMAYEIKEKLIEGSIATQEQIDKSITDIDLVPRDYLISLASVVQVSGRKT